MATSASRKAVMTLFCSSTCPYSHRARIVLKEKAIAADTEYVDPANPPEDLIELNPYGTTPTLVDRELVLYDSRIIMEYLDERFPHPPLYPMDPVARARARMLMHRIDQDWYSLLEEIETAGQEASLRARKLLRESLIAAAPAFGAKAFFMSEDYSLIDCAIAPLLWRLASLRVDLPRQAESIRRYAARLFERPAFQASLSESESRLPMTCEALSA